MIPGTGNSTQGIFTDWQQNSSETTTKQQKTTTAIAHADENANPITVNCKALMIYRYRLDLRDLSLK